MSSLLHRKSRRCHFLPALRRFAQRGPTSATRSGYTQVPQPAAVPPVRVMFPRKAGLSDNSAAAISYITIIPAIIFLVMEPYIASPSCASMPCSALACTFLVRGLDCAHFARNHVWLWSTCTC